MFQALREGALDTGGLTFAHRREHTAALNRLAVEGAADVVAVSLGVYPAIASAYQLLPHGASVGRGYGPVVVEASGRSNPMTSTACGSASSAPAPPPGWCCA